jgi:hypothetical protein
MMLANIDALGEKYPEILFVLREVQRLLGCEFDFQKEIDVAISVSIAPGIGSKHIYRGYRFVLEVVR